MGGLAATGLFGVSRTSPKLFNKYIKVPVAVAITTCKDLLLFFSFSKLQRRTVCPSGISLYSWWVGTEKGTVECQKR